MGRMTSISSVNKAKFPFGRVEIILSLYFCTSRCSFNMQTGMSTRCVLWCFDIAMEFQAQTQKLGDRKPDWHVLKQGRNMSIQECEGKQLNSSFRGHLENGKQTERVIWRQAGCAGLGTRTGNQAWVWCGGPSWLESRWCGASRCWWMSHQRGGYSVEFPCGTAAAGGRKNPLHRQG